MSAYNIQGLPKSVEEIKEADRAYILHPWTTQQARAPMLVVGGSGCYFWGPDERRYLDFYSQAANVNAGHQHPQILRAIKDQLEKTYFVESAFANEPAVHLALLLAQITPGSLSKTFFTTGGGEAIEHAVRIARSYTGRSKVVVRHRSYHGATYGAIGLSGDPRRPPSEPTIPGIVRVFPPYRYRCVFCKTLPECSLECAEHIRETLLYENPDTVAAILIEAITGSSGVVVPPPDYLKRVRRICDEFGVALIADEIYTGFGRTGKWFAVDHWGVTPDIMVLGKGITSGAIPLGAVVVSEAVSKHFESRMLWSGMTYFAHPMGCAAGIGAIRAYIEDRLVENADKMGKVLEIELNKLAKRHECVGEVRCRGLLACLELVKDRETREPILPWGPVTTCEVMGSVRNYCENNGLHLRTRWGIVFVAPPLCITETELRRGVSIMDEALGIVDREVRR